MTKIKNKLPKFTKQERHDPFLLALLGFLMAGLLFVGATRYRQSVLETQRLRDTIEADRYFMTWEMSESCAEQLRNTAGEDSIMVLKIKDK